MSNKKFITEISFNISKKLQRELSSQEVLYIVEYVDNLDMIKYKNMLINKEISVNKLKNSIENIILQDILEAKNPLQNSNNSNFSLQNLNIYDNYANIYDTHELSKLRMEQINTQGRNLESLYNDESNTQIIKQNENQVDSSILLKNINIGSICGINNVNILKKVFNPKACKKKYILLDSWYKNSINNGVYQWIYSDNANRSIGVFNTTETIRNITSIKLMQTVFPTYAINPLTYRLGVRILEFSDSNFKSSSEYHLILKFRYDFSNYAGLTPLQIEDFHDGIINFNIPITELNTLSLSFSDPVNQIIMPPDVMSCTFTTYAPSLITIRTEVPHNLVNGDKVFFNNFTTNDPTADVTDISIVNSFAGNSISSVTTYTFNITILNPVVSPISNLSINGYNNRFRFIFPFEISYLD